MSGGWACCDSIRSEGAVTLSENGDREYPLGEELVGRWCSADCEGSRMFRLVEADVTIVLLTNTGGADEPVSDLFFQVLDLVHAMKG